MARTINIPSAVYPVGTISRSVDSFPSDVRRLRVAFTRESWPGVPSDDVAIVTALWGDGSGGRATLPGGVILDKSGQPLAQSVIEIDVPIDADVGKRNVVDGTVTFDVIQSLRTAITIDVS
jgi:hypothetical protein